MFLKIIHCKILSRHLPNEVLFYLRLAEIELFNNEGLKIAHCLQREATKRTTYA